MNSPFESRPSHADNPRIRSLDKLFRARSLAIIGASSDPAKIGGKPIGFLKDNFSGTIVPINPNRDEIAGLACKPSIASLESPLDMAILALPAKAVEPALRECLDAGIRHINLFSAGFGEIDADGLAAQERLATLCRDAGARLLGPNSLGFINFHDGLFATFSSALDNIWPKTGNVGIAGQSGAVGTYIMALAAERGLGFSHFIATGNEADVDVADCVAWLAEDPQTSVIVAYLEGCRDGARLKSALLAARGARKPVIAIKPGATDAGQAAVQSHTGMLAGSKKVFDAVLEACGAWGAETIEETVDIAQACANGVFPKRSAASVITPSGGVGIMLADGCEEAGIDLPPLPQDAADAIRAILPLASTTNPVDTTAQVSGDFTLFGKVIDIVADASDVPIHFIFMAHMGKTPAVTDLLYPVLERAAETHRGKLMVLITRASEEFRAQMDALGYLVFEEPSRAVAAVRALAFFGAAFEKPAPGPSAVTASAEPGILAKAAASTSAAYAMLEAIGIRSAATRIAASEDEAVEAAGAIGYPVVLKVESPEIAHKTDVGGVRANIAEAGELRRAWRTMMETVRTAAPKATIVGGSISAMAGDGIDTIIGVKRDPVFGPVVLFGVGGVMTELFEDVVIAPAPVSKEQALAMIGKLKAARMFDGWRGAKSADRDAAADAIVALSLFADAKAGEMESIEINPFRVMQEGGLALDVLISLDATSE